MPTFIKLVLLASIFVAFGGQFFTEWGRNHPFLRALAAAVVVLTSIYLFKDVLTDPLDVRNPLVWIAGKKPAVSTNNYAQPQYDSTALEASSRDMDKILENLKGGRLYPTEKEADLLNRVQE